MNPTRSCRTKLNCYLLHIKPRLYNCVTKPGFYIFLLSLLYSWSFITATHTKKSTKKKTNFVEQTFAIDPISIISRNSEIGGSNREK